MSETNDLATQGQDQEIIDPNAALQPVETEALEGQEPSDDDQKPEPQKPPPKVPAGVLKRLSELSSARNAATQRAEAAEEMLRQAIAAQNPGQQPTQAPPGYVSVQDVQREFDMRAAQAQFNGACDAIADAGSKVDGFDDSLKTLHALGLNTQDPRAPLMQVLVELSAEEGARAIAALGADPDQADRLMRMSPARMAIEVAKVAAKPARLPVSRAPAPISPISGGATRSNDFTAMDDETQRAWLRKELRGG